MERKMTQITIETKHKLINFYQLISDVKAKGRQSRAITKFRKLLTEKLAELQDDEKLLIAQYYEVDDEGNAKKDEVVSANADIDISNEAKKRTAVAYINRELIESSQYTYDTLPTQEIDDTIEEVLHVN